MALGLRLAEGGAVVAGHREVIEPRLAGKILTFSLIQYLIGDIDVHRWG